MRTMRVLIIGGGGREHALGWAIRRSAERSGRAVALFFAPGNAGTEAIGTNVPLSATDADGLAAWAKEAAIDLAVVGPEAPLMAGVADRFRARGLKVVGPERAAARLEGSKAFAKALMAATGVPTAEFRVVDDAAAARRAVAEFGFPVVLKADGLAQGKGVLIARDQAEAEAALAAFFVERRFGDAAARVVVERFLPGREVSVMGAVAGEAVVLFPPVRDYKRAYDGDAGPNTGGMGAILPPPDVTPEGLGRIEREVFRPILAGLKERGLEYRGILYAGLMLTPEGPKVLEFNVRFGDPETQALVVGAPLDWLALLSAVADGTLDPSDPALRRPAGAKAPQAAVAVVAAREGYPTESRPPIELPALDGDPPARLRKEGAPGDRAPLEEAPDELVLFHAGTFRRAGKLFAGSGRVFALVAGGASLSAARARAYDALRRLLPAESGLFYRTDIGEKEAAEMDVGEPGAKAPGDGAGPEAP
ncbi:MAG: Phosphoribosylamine--glycine ligase [Hydrogenibacillus schlegelii]|uniref:Phosphoribosylamine--glycine ligase n=1 Tax=Hydrogenibacillus schlegelii TaxID=1484 RepID=A0A2T5GCK7_HYDSH|nr:phosphoribosylamine--glycine ligase [Hydrogenibacillus schlegelii]PTQ53919.1 MAG: Phosphoribosylamine--glycine ligase [Hydrogenibacillus schlegelii]